MVRFSEAESKDVAHAELGRFFDAVLDDFPPGTLPTRNEDYFDSHFLAETLTRQQCGLFDRALIQNLASP